jgi:hypothetical protein
MSHPTGSSTGGYGTPFWLLLTSSMVGLSNLCSQITLPHCWEAAAAARLTDMPKRRKNLLKLSSHVMINLLPIMMMLDWDGLSTTRDLRLSFDAPP